MVLALVCLWIGFAAGFLCAALLSGRAGHRRRDDGDAERHAAAESHAAARSFRVVRMPVKRRRAAREEFEEER